ncbi:hypothetical protein Ancab_006377 [Ancistrocladus abbreviatus]
MSYMSESKADEKVHKDEALVLILVGKGTVSAMLTWFFLFLVEYPSAEAKIRLEIQDIIPEDDVNKFHLFNTKQLSKLVYLQAALCEILRLFPAVPNLAKGSYESCVLPIGPRICLGKDVAIMETKAIAATIVHNYNV